MSAPIRPLMRRLNSREADFRQQLDELLGFEAATDDHIERSVAEILKNVRAQGDAAVLDYTRRFDQLDAAEMPAHIAASSGAT